MEIEMIPDEETLKLVTRDLGTSIVRIRGDAGGYDINASEWNNNDHAWYVLFRNGHALSDLKERPKHIRLVRMTNTKVSKLRG